MINDSGNWAMGGPLRSFGWLALVAGTAAGCYGLDASDETARSSPKSEVIAAPPNATSKGSAPEAGAPGCCNTPPCRGDAGADVDAADDALLDTDADPGADANPDPSADPDADAADAGCTCTPGGVLGSQSLACFCTVDACPSFDNAIDVCPPTPFPNDQRIDTYADCNLVVIEYSAGFDYGSYAYDATTHALVGGMYATDYDAFVCGSTRVFGIRAGTFPPPTCAISQSVRRCADGG